MVNSKDGTKLCTFVYDLRQVLVLQQYEILEMQTQQNKQRQDRCKGCLHTILATNQIVAEVGHHSQVFKLPGD